MNVELDDPGQILRMAGYDPRPQLAEAIGDDFTVAVEAFRRVDDVANIEVNAESRAIYCLDQLQVRIRTIGDRPAHRLDGELSSLGLDLVDDVPAIIHRCVEKLLRKVFRIGTVP